MKKFLILIIIAGLSIPVFSLNYKNNYQNGSTEGNILACMTDAKVYSLSVKGEYIFADIRIPGVSGSEKMFHFKKSEKELYSLLLSAKLTNSSVKVYFQHDFNQEPVKWLGEVAYHFLWAAELE